MSDSALSSPNIEIPVSWKFIESESDYDRRNNCYESEFILNSKWTMSCSFTIHSANNSILRIYRQSAATDALVSGYFSIYNKYNYCKGEKSFSHVFKPNCNSKCINLGISIRENSCILGKVIISEESEKYASDGVEVEYLKEEEPLSQNSSPSTCQFEPLKELSDDFARLLDEKTPSFTDVELKCGTLTIPAHKNILSTRSPVFRAMFSNKMTETRDNEVNITDIDAPVLQAMLTYVYTGQTGNLSYNLAGDLLFAADKYELEGLKIVMIEYLKSNVSVENVLQLLVLGDLHAQDLKDFAMCFIRDRCTEFSVLENTEEWQTLAKERSVLAIEVLTLLIKSKEKK
ncbi:TD and POZ domain-containing protein 5 [Trichonephila clavata]|uniref:TD and POZ domain-containing protein 5 n=1 Tax=Trichonephila clavata TaxID=2740835 RepID=A0A8X6GGU8_TRICU|nr:TD and POZ domain-containing protein 5 [Trichonephila clavata]